PLRHRSAVVPPRPRHPPAPRGTAGGGPGLNRGLGVKPVHGAADILRARTTQARCHWHTGLQDGPIASPSPRKCRGFTGTIEASITGTWELHRVAVPPPPIGTKHPPTRMHRRGGTASQWIPLVAARRIAGAPRWGPSTTRADAGNTSGSGDYGERGPGGRMPTNSCGLDPAAPLQDRSTQ